MRFRALAVAGAAIVTAVMAVGAGQAVEAAPPAFVQQRANEVGSGRTNSLAFSQANTAGNTIIVSVFWNNTGTVSLADTRGNTYVAAAPRRAWGPNWSEQVFYAKNIAGGANTVTATFGTTIAGWGIIYLHEYSGLDKVNPLDATTSGVGTSRAMSSGSLTTTVAGDLLFAAGASENTVISAGTGWTTRSTAYGNRTQDRLATAPGAYSATPTQNGNAWVVQLLALKPDSGSSDTAAPTVPSGLSADAVSTTQVNLSWVASTDNVAVTGYRIYRNGTQVGTSPTTSYSDTGLTPSTTYTYSVAAYDAAGNVSAPSATATATTQSPPPDTTPPAVAVTFPASGATVSGVVTVAASATDDVGVAGVQFLLDGNALGAEDTASPYTVSWTTTGNGAHTLAARARDAAGNSTTSAPVTVTVDNTAPPAPAIVAGYAFDEGAGTTTADASGGGTTGTLLNGASWGPGRHNTALALDGADDYVDLGNRPPLQLTSSMTISAWINSAAFPGDDAAIVSRRASVGFQLDTTIDRGPRTIGFKLTNASGGNMFRYGATAMQLDTWYHVAGVYDAAARTMTVYLDGQPDNGPLEGTITASQTNSPNGVNIGRRSSGGFLFDGRIDDVRVYDRALTADEIRADMAAGLAGGAPGDLTPPAVAMTAPAAGAQVRDIVTLTATASDAGGVRDVQFLVDGVATGSPDTTAPYGLDWDTRSASNGAHAISARARDMAGNSATSPAVTVNVVNSNFFQNEVLATGFELPTSIEFLPDARMLVIELAGRIRVLPPPYTTPDPTPFLQLTNIGSAGVQQGIYDIALDPAFTTNHYYYVFYTLGSPNRDRLSRFTANATNTGTVAGSEVVLYQDPQDANAEHHGGGIAFGNDGKLYFTTGEHFTAGDAQLLTSPRGKIHRINPDGTVPTDNPFYDGAGPRVDSIWAYGLRNPYRAYYDAPTGRLYLGDVGGNDYSTAKEEINVGAAGANYGWPDSEGACSAPCTSPLYSYPHNGRDASVTGGFVYHGAQFPSAYQGDYFFADYTQNWIRRLDLDASGNVVGVANFEPANGSVDGPYGDIVYLTEGPDGALYYVDLGYSDIGGTFGVSKIRRIRYLSSNLPPVVQSSGTPTSGLAPLAVAFSSAGSSDPEGGPLTFAWDFGDGTSSTAPNPSHTYTQPGRYDARLTVSDGTSSSLGTPIPISVGSVPIATILTPQDGATFRAGDVISFSGDATDAEDGPLPASAFTWNIDFLHEGHVHPGIPQTGVKSGSFTIPTSGHDFSGDTRYRITLTVTDSSGLSTTTSVIVRPVKVNLTFATTPPGLTLYVDGIARPTPFVYDTLVGFTHTIEARDQASGTTSYAFASWSDGGAQQHNVTVPTTATTYTATYNPIAIVPTPTFVQVAAATPQTNQSTVALAYPQAQVAGDTNIIAVGWNDAVSNVMSVTDSVGNVYQLAAPTARGNGLSQAIYYAANVNAAAAGSNTVTVTYSGAVPYADVRITAYRGLDLTSPFDGAASASGSASSATSGSVTTRWATELVFGAGMTSGAFTSSPAGFTTRIITNPDQDIVNDRVVTTLGTYAASATQSGSWVMQVATFRAAGQ